jgi:hypothetical protein
MHGRYVTVPVEWNHFHIPGEPTPATYIEPGELYPTVNIRKGTYSQVAYNPTDFEWDGWNM